MAMEIHFRSSDGLEKVSSSAQLIAPQLFLHLVYFIENFRLRCTHLLM